MEVAINAGGIELPGIFEGPADPAGVVVFAHGSGSSRLSPRNAEVAVALHARGFGTLLFDLLTQAEALDRHNVFDIPLLAERLTGGREWASAELPTSPVGLFGASTGAAAALVVAAQSPAGVAAVVSRGGRPDLADEALDEVAAPCLLIVGGSDEAVLEMNMGAATRLQCEHDVAVVPGAGHLFEEPGALAQVAELAGAWFDRWLR